MEKIIDALIANAAANVAVLVLIVVVFTFANLLQQQRKDHTATSEKLADAMGGAGP
jgi:preprotein translocase subunit YajC